MEARVSAVENILVGIQNGMAEFTNRLENMLSRADQKDKETKDTIDANDVALKTALEDEFQALEKDTKICAKP